MASIAAAFIPPITTEAGVVTMHDGVNRSLDFMAKNFARPVQLKDMVKAAKLSRRGFIKAFRKNVGSTPGAYLRNLRIKYAKQLLAEHDMSLKDIAPRCGFRSENTFCVAFTRMTKMSPKKYQRTYWLTALRNHHGSGEWPQTGRVNLPKPSLSQRGGPPSGGLQITTA